MRCKEARRTREDDDGCELQEVELYSAIRHAQIVVALMWHEVHEE